MIIGLTGRNASGKGAAAVFLKNKGFVYYSLSDVLRAEARRRDIPLTRENLIVIGQELRDTRGASYLAERTFELLDLNQNYVIDSCRHEDEVNFFRKVSDYYLLAVRSDPKIRFERLKARARENDPQTFEAFLELDNRDIVPSEALADYTIYNDGSLEGLHSALDRLLVRWMKKQK